MTNHIDLGSVLRRTLSASLYSNLVTRPTGAAVRSQIEQLVGDALATGRALTVIDFSHVTMIDFSCADEIVAKLLLGYGSHQSGECYFVFRGMADGHRDAVETVLERRGLALVVEGDDGMDLVGVLDGHERRAWEMLKRRGRLVPADLTGADTDADDVTLVREALEGLHRRRLIMRSNDMYLPVGEWS